MKEKKKKARGQLGGGVLAFRGQGPQSILGHSGPTVHKGPTVGQHCSGLLSSERWPDSPPRTVPVPMVPAGLVLPPCGVPQMYRIKDPKASLRFYSEVLGMR